MVPPCCQLQECAAKVSGAVVSAWMLAAVAGVYMYVAWGYWQAGRVGLAIAFMAYAVSNLGFVLDLMYGQS